jgi:hypothetical protein
VQGSIWLKTNPKIKKILETANNHVISAGLILTTVFKATEVIEETIPKVPSPRNVTIATRIGSLQQILFVSEKQPNRSIPPFFKQINCTTKYLIVNFFRN